MTLAAVLLPLLGATLAGVVFAVAAPIADALLGRDARILHAHRRAARVQARAEIRATRTAELELRVRAARSGGHPSRSEPLARLPKASRLEPTRHRAAR